jgi:hypothetical protein
MVRAARLRHERGRSGRGCLLTLLLLAVVVYYGYGALGSYVRYWRMKDEMRSQANLGPNLDDAVIRRRLVTKAQELELPTAANRFVIRRLARPREIVITTTWQETIELPFYNWVVRYKPEARALL